MVGWQASSSQLVKCTRQGSRSYGSSLCQAPFHLPRFLWLQSPLPPTRYWFLKHPASQRPTNKKGHNRQGRESTAGIASEVNKFLFYYHCKRPGYHPPLGKFSWPRSAIRIIEEKTATTAASNSPVNCHSGPDDSHPQDRMTCSQHRDRDTGFGYT